MGLFDGLNTAPMGLTRLYFQPGQYLVKVARVRGITATESFKGKGSFVVECEILYSDNPMLVVGASPAWVQTIGPAKDERERAFGSIKQFFSAVLDDPILGGIDVEQLADGAVSDANPIMGTVLGLVCVHKPTKAKPGKPAGIFTTHTWRPGAAFAAALEAAALAGGQGAQ